MSLTLIFFFFFFYILYFVKVKNVCMYSWTNEIWYLHASASSLLPCVCIQVLREKKTAAILSGPKRIQFFFLSCSPCCSKCITLLIIIEFPLEIQKKKRFCSNSMKMHRCVQCFKDRLHALICLCSRCTSATKRHFN